MNDEIYIKLRNHIDSMPAGYPRTESGAEIKMLKRFFTPDEAELALHVTAKPERAEAIASRSGRDEALAVKMIEEMAAKGNIFRILTPAGPRYMLPNFVMGLYEWHVKTIDKEIAEYADEIYDALSEQHWKDRETKQFRIVPVNKAVDGRSHVNSYDILLELIKGKAPYAVAPCICRTEQMQKGNEVSRPLETCFTFGLVAQYYIHNGIGKELTEEQLIQKLAECEDASLVPLSTNAKNPVNMCMCDRDSCQLFRYLRKFEKPAEQIHSSFFAEIDTASCIGCGKCTPRCQIDAITATDEKTAKGKNIFSVSRDRCIGCGLCVKACPTGAISMALKENLPQVPENAADMNIRIAQERAALKV